MPKAVEFEGRAGDVCFWHGQMVHTGTKNVNRNIRMALIGRFSRKDSNGDDHLIYPMSARNFSFKTDADGVIDLGLFDTGDQVEFLIEMSGGSQRVSVEIGDADTQTITVKKKLIP